MAKKVSKQQQQKQQKEPSPDKMTKVASSLKHGQTKETKSKFSGTKRSRTNDDGDNNNNNNNNNNDEHREAQWSKSKKKRMRLIKAKQNHGEDGSIPVEKAALQTSKNATFAAETTKLIKRGSSATKDTTTTTTATTTPGREQGAAAQKTTTTTTQPSALQKSFQERLSGSRFRILNEELYTTTSSTALARFQQNPALFDEYHEGFRHQVEQWPVNPVTVLVERLKSSVTKEKMDSLQKKKNAKIVVADFGCGDAELAKQLLTIKDANNKQKQSLFTVHSFDLVAKGPNAELITASDVANTPLTTGTVDVGIFCLSLMGTNLPDFIREAHRVLKPDGRLHIAEVRSRFESATTTTTTTRKTNGKDDNGGSSSSKKDELQTFIQVLDQLGFDAYHTDRSNKMFVLLELKKNGKKPKTDLAFTAKACIYKRR